MTKTISFKEPFAAGLGGGAKREIIFDIPVVS